MRERQDYFNEAVRLGRLLRGKSYGEVTEATGIPTWRLRAFESGTSPVRPDEFVRLWAFLARDERAMAPSREEAP